MAPSPSPNATQGYGVAAEMMISDILDKDDFTGAALDDAIKMFENGSWAQAAACANHALGAKEAMQDMLPSRDEQLRLPVGAEADGNSEKFCFALDVLTETYGDAGENDQAEGIFLRMLAWREGLQQQKDGHSNLAGSLFKKSMEYNHIEDATWFLRGLKPEDAHAVPEIIPLLALGERVAAKASVATWTLALSAKHRRAICQHGGVELLSKALTQYPDNAELAAAGCAALRLLCQGHALAAQTRRNLESRLNGARMFAHIMRIHHNDVEVQRECCGAFGVIASDNMPGDTSIVASDGLLLCLEAIIACPDLAVGDAACKAIATICGRKPPGSQDSVDIGDSESVAWQAALRQECGRGITFCTEALEEQLNHKGSRIVLQSLTWATMIFLDDASLREQAIAWRSARDPQVSLITLVASCMATCPGYAQLQVPCCGILWRLTVGHAFRDDAVRMVAQAGSITQICKAMQDLPCNMDLQQLAVGALRNLAFGNDANKTLVLKCQGIQSICMGMKRYPKDAKLQEQAIGALTSLCDTVGRAALCARLGGVDCIIAALRKHAAVGHIAELGCIILCMFCDDLQLKNMIKRSGALQIAKALSRTDNPEAQQWGCELLRDLSDE